MTVRWHYEGESGAEGGRSEAFADRDAAEEWMGRAWQELVDAGVEQVELRDEERDEILYRMSLREQ
jgi:hypothetical protein